MQEPIRESSKNGIIGQERKENQEQHSSSGGGCRQENQHDGEAFRPTWLGLGAEGAHRTNSLTPFPCSSPVWTEVAWLEGEIISSRISRVSRKDSENYSSLISFHFISVCLS